MLNSHQKDGFFPMAFQEINVIGGWFLAIRGPDTRGRSFCVGKNIREECSKGPSPCVPSPCVPENVVSVSYEIHIKISAYYSKVYDFTNGLRLRDWLAGQSFEVQYQFGLDVLKMFGVTK